ncbi:hypothetical protein LTR86_003617 [Recurvomyces mirabilis]|nr:hypothetical protein LTR86_003617 [Recurvomyces mirabilis]
MSMMILDMLPAETLVGLAEQAEENDLAPLRASCRAMAAATHNKFMQTFFVRRKHMWTAYSLQTLEAISDHQVLAKHIKSIESRLVSLDPNRHNEHSSHDCLASSLEALASVRPPVEVEQGHVIKKFRQQEELLTGLDHGKRPLMRAFANLARLGITPGISLTGHAGRSLTSCFGFKALATALDPKIDSEDFSASGCYQLTHRLVDTVLCSGLSVSELTVGSLQHRGMANGFGYHADQEIFGMARRAVRGLSSLTLYIEEEGSLPEPRQRHTCYMVPTCFAASKHLQTLNMTGANGEGQEWVEMFDYYKQSLRHVRLIDAMIVEPVGGKCWSPILQWLAENLALDALKLIGLNVLRDDTYGYYSRDGAEVTAILQGKDQIRVQLGEICADSRYIPMSDDEYLGRGPYEDAKVDFGGLGEGSLD